MASILRFFGACIFLPFIGLYSFVLGPILKLVLIPGGLLLLLLILGKEDGVIPLIKAFNPKSKKRDCVKVSTL